MADIDTKVLYLETPPTSAPKTSYILGVRIRNTGLHARAASGYVQVFDKDTGMLVKTYPVASAEIDPGQEKQAFAAEDWNLTDELVGKQFILAGMVTCDGDMVPENDILHPTTVTVAETPPGPPPAVTPHKPQHQDGGNDEIDVTALHGVLYDDQPPAAHSSDKHDGTVPVLIDGLVPVEQLPDMPVAQHGSPDHDDSVEATERKEQPGGYPGLDTVGLIALEHLALNPDPARFLRGDATWAAVGTAPPPGTPIVFEAGEAPSQGENPDSAYAPLGHSHGGQGGIIIDQHINLVSQPNAVPILDALIHAGCLCANQEPFERFCVRIDGYASYHDDPGPGSFLQFDLVAGRDGDTLWPRHSMTVPVPAEAEDGMLRLHWLTLGTGDANTVGHILHSDATNPGSIILGRFSGNTGVIDRTMDMRWQVLLSIIGTATVDVTVFNFVLETIYKSWP